MAWVRRALAYEDVRDTPMAASRIASRRRRASAARDVVIRWRAVRLAVPRAMEAVGSVAASEGDLLMQPGLRCVCTVKASCVLLLGGRRPGGIPR